MIVGNDEDTDDDDDAEAVDTIMAIMNTRTIKDNERSIMDGSI
jgi:hypothetical protein